ncbi:hypothetical protein [Streptomyces sp. NBC_00470]|uniref:hypothetical protein n=1 Tax=Streptomyces sp. NBC_00470 TaxID=2975753 RepID=UPI002F9160D1
MIDSLTGAPRHEVDLINCLLRDPGQTSHLVDWNRQPEPKYWLTSRQFQDQRARDVYWALRSGGFAEIDRLAAAYPQESRARIAADVVVRIVQAECWRRAPGDQAAADKFHDQQYWADLHKLVVQTSNPAWPGAPANARHHAYVTAAEHRHGRDNGRAFALTKGRSTEPENRLQEFIVIAGVLDDARRAASFQFAPDSRDASPYWLQPQDFSDPVAAELWDALVTGPDPAISLPEARDSQLTAQQQTQAMLDHVHRRLLFNDQHRSTSDAAAKARIDGNEHRSVVATLRGIINAAHQPSEQGLQANFQNAPAYAARYILEPSIPAAVDQLAGKVHDIGTGAASFGSIAMGLSEQGHLLDRLWERLSQAHRFAAPTNGQDPKLAPLKRAAPPAFSNQKMERDTVRAVVKDPGQLRDGLASALTPQDFTTPEHRFLFQAAQNHAPGQTPDFWLIASQARALAQEQGAPPLDSGELMAIHDDRRAAPPAATHANHLMLMTVRRVTQSGSTIVRGAARRPGDNRQLVILARGEVRAASEAAMRAALGQQAPAERPAYAR